MLECNSDEEIECTNQSAGLISRSQRPPLMFMLMSPAVALNQAGLSRTRLSALHAPPLQQNFGDGFIVLILSAVGRRLGLLAH